MAAYVFTPAAVAGGATVRFDTASGSNSPATVYPLDYAQPIPGALLRAHTTTGNLPRIESDSATLYQKTLDYRGVTVTATTTLTGVTQATGAPTDLATALSGTYARVTQAVLGNRWGFVGDSLTGANSLGDVFPRYATLLSGGKARYVVNAGVAGQTSAQIVGQIPTVVAAGVTCCNIMAGTNDVIQSVPLATFAANVTSMVTQLRAAGITPVLCTIPPKVTFRAGVVQFNAWLRYFSGQQGIPLVDLNSVLVDPATGDYLSAYANDGTHPNAAGYLAMGQKWANDLSSLLAPYRPLMAVDNADTLNIAGANALCLTNTAGKATSWTCPTVTNVSYSIDSSDTTIIGNAQQVDLAAATAQAVVVVQGKSTGWAVGDWLMFSGRVKASSQSGGATFSVQASFSGGSPGSQKFLQDVSQNFDGVYVGVVQVPTGTTYVGTQYLCGKSGVGGTGTYKIAQSGIYNLTALGLTPPL